MLPISSSFFCSASLLSQSSGSLGVVLTEVFTVRGNWLRWLPTAVGMGWLVLHRRRYAMRWDWIAQLPLILLVSVTTASFVWTFDHVILLPAVVQGAVWFSNDRRAARQNWILTIFVTMNALLLVSRFFVVNDFWYFWTAPAFLLLYLALRRQAHLPNAAI